MTSSAPEPTLSSPPTSLPVSPVWRWVFRAAIVLPVFWVVWRSTDLVRNIPMWDEFETVLRFLLEYRAAGSLAGTLREFFALANEHCVFTSRLAFVAVYHASGTANFVALAVVGNAFLAAMVVLGRRGFGDRWMAGLWTALAVLLLAGAQHYENLFSSYASIDHFQIVLLTAASLIGLTRRTDCGLAVAAAFAGLAVFTLAHGLAVLAAGNLLLAMQRRWRHFVYWSVAALLITIAFALLLSTAQQAMAMRWTLRGLVGLGRYWLTMLGGVPAVGHTGLAPYLGALLVLGLPWVLLRRRVWEEAPFSAGLAVTAIIGCLLISYGRSEAALTIPALSSRYMVQSGLAWLATAMIVVALAPGGARRWAGGLLLLAGTGLNLASNATYHVAAWEFTQRRIDAARQYDAHGTIGGMKRPIFPKGEVGDRILATAAREGLYRMPVERSHEVLAPAALELHPIVFFIDKLEMAPANLHFRGWMITLQPQALDLEPHLALQAGDQQYLFRGFTERRPDVAAANPGRPEAIRAGFYFVIPRDAVPPGQYNLRVVLIGHRRNYYNETKRTVVFVPP